MVPGIISMNKKTSTIDQQVFFQQQQQQFHLASKNREAGFISAEKAIQELLTPYLPKPNIQHTI